MAAGRHVSFEQVERYLPPGYARVSCNVEQLPTGCNVGIVIPSYRRERYLERCLETLQRSDLAGAVLCFVDETEARHDTKDAPGFTCLYDVDSPDGDIERVGTGFEDAYLRAAQTAECVAFNEMGWLKYEVCPASEMRWISDGNYKFFIRDDVLARDPEYRAFLLPASADDAANVRLLQGFNCRAPIIRLFKNRHGNVHDSLLHGWDLLHDLFEVRHLCSLDSDMIVESDWLMSLLDAHQRAATDFSDKPVVSTAFNFNGHVVVEDRAAYLIKESIGGANILFSRWNYGLIRPALRSLMWDWDVVEAIHANSGIFVSTPRSRVQHIGARGMWSAPTSFARAKDFDGG